MRPKSFRVRSFGADGTVVLEDGRELQAVVSESGSLGAMPRTDKDRFSVLDQVVPLGLDQSHPVEKFDLSGLDQV